MTAPKIEEPTTEIQVLQHLKAGAADPIPTARVVIAVFSGTEKEAWAGYGKWSKSDDFPHDDRDQLTLDIIPGGKIKFFHCNPRQGEPL